MALTSLAKQETFHKAGWESSTTIAHLFPALCSHYYSTQSSPLSDLLKGHSQRAISDGLVVVPEHDGRKRLVIPEGPLQQGIYKHFMRKVATLRHAGIYCTLHTFTHYFFWGNMGKKVPTYATSCMRARPPRTTTDFLWRPWCLSSRSPR